MKTAIPADAACVTAASAQGRLRSRRLAFLAWLRRAHGWLGLWGALVGMLFGATGIVMNHRAVLPIPLKKFEQSTVQLEIARLPEDPGALAALLQQRLGFETLRMKVEPAATVHWNERAVTQPELWQFWLEAPQRSARAEYYVGNRFVKVERSDANWIATLTRLHQAIGVSALWVLFADTIAGSILLLALSGLVLWTRLERRRAMGLAVSLSSLALAAGIALASF